MTPIVFDGRSSSVSPAISKVGFSFRNRASSWPRSWIYDLKIWGSCWRKTKKKKKNNRKKKKTTIYNCYLSLFVSLFVFQLCDILFGFCWIWSRAETVKQWYFLEALQGSSRGIPSWVCWFQLWFYTLEGSETSLVSTSNWMIHVWGQKRLMI